MYQRFANLWTQLNETSILDHISSIAIKKLKEGVNKNVKVSKYLGKIVCLVCFALWHVDSSVCSSLLELHVVEK